MKKQLLDEIGSELTIQQNFVETSFPSIFSKEDVHKVLDAFAQAIFARVESIKESGITMSAESIQDLSEQLMAAVTRKVDRLEADEVVDFSSASMSISYNNQIEIDSMDYNSEVVNEAVEEAVDQVLHDYFTFQEEEATETPYATEQ